MFRFDSPLFWYKFIFLLELIVSEGLFTFKLKKRNHFGLRLAASVIAVYVIAFLFPLLSFGTLYVSFMFIFLFCITIMLMYFCYYVPLFHIIFCGIAAYTVQHIAYEFYTTFTGIMFLNRTDMLYYETGEFVLSGWAIAIGIEIYVVVYGIMYAFFGTRIRTGSNLMIGNVQLLVISGVVVFIAIVLSIALIYGIKEDVGTLTVSIARVCIATSCIISLFLQFSVLDRKEMQREIDTLQQLHKVEQRHYILFKENVDAINVKCHDLKHQISRISMSGNAKDSVINEIENALMIYDSKTKTGNEILDIVLTEKRLICANNGISFSCMVDGKHLSFMSDPDICSLFGNALDNAIEAAMRIENPANRSIGMTVKTSRGFLSVRIRNRFDGNVLCDGELFRTSKGDAINHGYGLKSIKSIVQRYEGYFSVVIENNIFNLNLLFPLKNN